MPTLGSVLGTTSFPAGFPGAASRTDASRLTDIKNVKDFGAVGDGIAYDTAAIQAALDYVTSPYSTANRGMIFFPPGSYLVNASLTYQATTSGIQRIAFVGAPGARVFGSVASDAIFKRSPDALIGPIEGPIWFEGLSIENTHTTGKAVTLHCTIGAKITNCYINAFIGIETYNSQCVTIDSTVIIRNGSLTRTGSVGIVAGNATSIINTDVTGFEHGLRHQNTGLLVHGGRFETNNVGMYLGIKEDGTSSQDSSFSITGPSMESNGSGIIIDGGAGSVSGVSVSASGSSQPFDFDYGIRVLNGNNISFSGVTVGIDDAYDNAGFSIEGGTDISLNAVASPSWNIASIYGLTMQGCNAELTVATLPATSRVGTILPVSDATATTVGSTVAGGGSNHVTVVRSAGVWRII